MARNSVGWFEIYVQDLPRARRFYEAVFATTLSRIDEEGGTLEMWSFPAEHDAPGTGGALVKMEGMPSGGNSTIVYFLCDDCAVEAQRAATNGGRIFKDKFSIDEYGFVALVYDSEENMIGLHSMQ